MENVDLGFILSHWPFFVVALGLGLTGEIVKTIVLDHEKLARVAAKVVPKGAGPFRTPPASPAELKANPWIGLYHRTLPAHAAIVGALIGCLPSMPCPDDFCANATMKVLYYCAAGMFSSWVYDAARHMAKKRLEA